MGAIRMRVQTADLWTNSLERNDGLRIKQLNDEFVKCWLEQNRLQLNTSRSGVIIFGPNKVDSAINDVLGTWTKNVQSKIRNLGVIFDSALTFDHKIKCVVKSCFFHLRTIAKKSQFSLFLTLR